MAAFSAHFDDSDSDFGYDFTPEDEQLLLQLGSNPALQSATPTVDTVIGAIDTVPGRTEVIATNEPTDLDYHDADTRDRQGDSGAALLPPEVDSRGPQAPLPLLEDITYPDCMCRISHSCFLRN